MTDIHDNIRAIRVLKNLSQEYVADSMGVSQSAYGKLERGETQVTWDKLQRIAVVLETTPWEIANFDTERPYLNTGNSAAYNEGSALASSQEGGVLRERIKYLEKLNTALAKNLADKEEIIRLLKRGQSEK